VSAAGPVQPFRFVPPLVHVPIPGPIVYGPGPFLTSRYNPLAGPPYALPVFNGGHGHGGTYTAATFAVSYHNGRHSYIYLRASNGAAFPHKDVTTVKDPGHPTINDFQVMKTWLKDGDKLLIIRIQGKGGPPDRDPVQSGNLTVTLAPQPPPPPVDPVPVIYVEDP
jgi:hypothetical protein